MNTDTITKGKLDEWVELIQRQEMPIFDTTVRKIITLSSDDLAPVSDLAQVILQDASLTARILRLANSSYYNPLGIGISTITRAVIILGFNAVRDMALAITLIDELVKGAARERLARELARTMHAATQARGIATACGDKSPEEVFIATLLFRIGELAFWCFSGDTGAELERLTQASGMTPEQAQEQLLGFKLNHLSKQLIRDWHLTELLQEATARQDQNQDRVQNVLMGQQIARCAEEKGWRSNEMDGLVQKIAKFTKLPIDQARNMLYQKARAAAAMTTEFGARFAVPYIPQPNLHSLEENTAAEPTESAPASLEQFQPKPPSPYPAPDAQLQIRILRELSSLLDASKYNFSSIMELVLEGIYRGVGMDRVLFALTTPDKGCIKAKYALGVDQQELIKGFRFVRSAHAPNILFQSMDCKRPDWITSSQCQKVSSLISHDLIDVIGRTPFLLAPIIVNQQCIGLLYADRALSKRALDSSAFDDFKHFVKQANIGLSLAASRPRHKD